MSYTYLLEKYQFFATARLVRDCKQVGRSAGGTSEACKPFRVREGFENNLKAIISLSLEEQVPLIIIKQVTRAPVIIESMDTLDSEQLEVLYERHLGDADMFTAQRDTIIAINQRYVLSLTEAIAKLYDVPVIDFVRDYDRDVPKEYFTDLVHQTADGNKMLAQYIFDGLGEYLH